MNNNHENQIGKILNERNMTLATAESCTGGLIGHRITNVPGSSNYFERGLIVYSYDAKMELLNVPKETLDKFGAVSSETVLAMANGIKNSAGTNLGLAVTGIAGPTGGTPDKPVGLVYIALATDDGIDVQKFRFDGEREDVKIQTAEAALGMLLDYLMK
jgi:PncC family amidohydrolase